MDERNYHPEAAQYEEYQRWMEEQDMEFHESKKLSSDDRKVVLVDVITLTGVITKEYYHGEKYDVKKPSCEGYGQVL